MSQATQSTRGVLHAKKSEESYNLVRSKPNTCVAGIIETFWRVDWDLDGHIVHKQQNIPDTCIHMVFEASSAYIIGAVSKRYEVELTGKSHIFGIKFRPGGFHALTQMHVSNFTDSKLKINEVFCKDGEKLVSDIHQAQSIEQMQSISEAFLQPKLPASFEEVDTLDRLISEIYSNSEIMRVSDLSERLAISERSLQRLFSQQIGLSPKWVIRKCRIQEVLSQLEGGDHDWLHLITQLGYFDQSHFIKDFTSLIGVTPTQYAKQLSKQT